jgi:predicted phage terminase large subunit-like protein
LVKRNQDLAGDKLLEIEREYLNNPFLKQNLKKVVEESASAFQVVVVDPLTHEEIEVRIEAHGKGPTLRGALWGDLRPQIMVIDDVQTKDDMDSDKVLKRDWEWFLDDVLFLSTYGRIFMIANNLGEACISERIMNTPGHFNFECMRIPRTSDLTETGAPAWPAKDTQEKILKEYETYKAAHQESIWIRNCMCECIGEQDRVFFKDDFQYYPLTHTANIVKECNVYLRMDTAVKDKDTSDYTAIVVFGINPDNHTFVLDISYGHYSTDKKKSELYRLVRKWSPLNAGIEMTNEAYQLIKDIRAGMAAERCFFTLKELQHCGRNKAVRIETSLQPRYSSRTVWHPESAPWLIELEHELLMFTKTGGKRSLKDDLIDALSYIGQDTSVPMRRSQYNNTTPTEVKCEVIVV